MVYLLSAIVSSLYIHIPFCTQACSYCDFHFSTSSKLREPLIDALVEELNMRNGELSNPLETIYFGGGSPSILGERELHSLFDAIHKNYDVSQVKEVTLESNPDDHTSEKLRLWKNLGVDRLSIGIQSFIDRDLKMMNRAHNAQQAQECTERARDEGFERLSIDLIYGIPNQSFEEWQSNVERAIGLTPNHLSAYCLTVEENTALHHQIQKGEIQEKVEESIEAEYLHLHQSLESAGWNHYEISNFARPGREAIHNSAYWSGKPYLGIGPSAHSFNGSNNRRWNVANNARYINSIQSNGSFWESEILSESDRFNERIMTGLRQAKGLSFSDQSKEVRSQLLEAAKRLQYAHQSKLVVDENCIRVSPEHWLMTDFFARELFVDEES